LSWWRWAFEGIVVKAILFAVLVFASASAGGTAQRTSEGSCTRFDCTADTGVTAGETVNRSAKGDRLSIRPLRTMARDQKLAEGCEPLASSLSRSSLANIAGRCLS
jgi:hypothetical protein